MNGALNLSVVDGWWGEATTKARTASPTAGRSSRCPRPPRRNPARCRRGTHRYELLQDHVIPTYYRTGPMGYSPEWVAMAKRSIATIAPRFNVIRMVSQYVAKFYAPAARNGRQFAGRILP